MGKNVRDVDWPTQENNVRVLPRGRIDRKQAEDALFSVLKQDQVRRQGASLDECT